MGGLPAAGWTAPLNCGVAAKLPMGNCEISARIRLENLTGEEETALH